MNSEIKNKIDLMVENYEVLRNRFLADSKFLRHFSALHHAIYEKKVDIDELKKIRNMIKENTGAFSFFRGTNEAILMSLLFFQDDYETIFKKSLDIYEKIKSFKMSHSNFIPLASYIIAKEVPFDMYDFRINRMKEFYGIIKKGHYWTTSARDYIFLILLAAKDIDVEKTCKKIDYCYNRLREIGLPKGPGLQVLSYIIAISGQKSEQAIEKIINICGEFKARNLKLGGYVIPNLGILALSNDDFSDVAQNIKEADEYLKTKKGYGFLRLSNDMRMLLVVSLICHVYLEKEKGVINEANIIDNFITAQQLSIISAACSINKVATPANS